MILREQRLEALEGTLEELRELNETMPVVVEGKRDVRALRRLDLTGEIFIINTGTALIDLCDRIAARYAEIVLLTDWDRTGGAILHKMRENLRGRVRLHRDVRKSLAVWSEVYDVESLPTYMETLRQHVAMATRDVPGRHRNDR